MNLTKLFFTDLDGTLLDHHSYSAAAAVPGMEALQKNDVPLIFCSSKTLAEQLVIQNLWQIRYPLIFENGSGIFFPEKIKNCQVPPDAQAVPGGYCQKLGHFNSIELREFLADINRAFKLGLRSFWDVPDETMHAVTGLSAQAAPLARERQATLTIIDPIDPMLAQQINRHLSPMGLSMSRGGRFYTLQDKQVDKGMAVQRLAQYYGLQARLHVGAVGDSLNDYPMLAAVAHPYLVQTHQGIFTEIAISELTKIEAPGPLGFNIAVSKFLNA